MGTTSSRTLGTRPLRPGGVLGSLPLLCLAKVGCLIRYCQLSMFYAAQMNTVRREGASGTHLPRSYPRPRRREGQGHRAENRKAHTLTPKSET